MLLCPTLPLAHPTITGETVALRCRGGETGIEDVEPFKTVLSGDREAIAKLTMPDLEKIAVATLTGMSTEQFQADVMQWLATAKDPRWHRPYTELRT